MHKKVQCETKGEPVIILKFPACPALSEGAGWEWGGGINGVKKWRKE